MDDFEIDVQENQQNKTEESVQLPMNFLMFGEIEHDDIKVYIKQDVYKALEKYALEDIDHERGTILLGNHVEVSGKTHVIISHYIEARYTDASASTLTFTHETWDYVYKEQDSKFPDKKIVGWQHTHPSYGIFLSNYDLFIHENFFNMPFQVAYVIDPVQNLRGFFQWKNGKIEKLKGYYIYDDIGNPIKISQTVPHDPPKESTNKKPVFLTVLTILALIFSLLNLFLIVSLNKSNNKQQAQNEYVKESIAKQKDELSDLNEIISALSVDIETKDQLIESMQNSIKRTEDELENQSAICSSQIKTIKIQENLINQQEDMIIDLQKRIEELENTPKSDPFIYHTIQSGESLSSICAKYGINYWKNKNIILGINNITDENKIIAGQALLIPQSIVEQ